MQETFDAGGQQARPLAGKTVALVHPAWQACGSHKVFVAQAAAYRAMGASVRSIAVADDPKFRPGSQAERYMQATSDLVADEREWIAMSPWAALSRPVIGAAVRRLRGDIASLRVAVASKARRTAKRADLSKVDLIHCNHFFCMPVARLIADRRAVPIILESHDVQARQYAVSKKNQWVLPPAVTFEDMLAIELAQMQDASVLVHLNADEAEAFKAHLPQKQHRLLFPSVDPVASAGEGTDLLIIAASNEANFLSLEWFLKDVMPLVRDLPIKIYGNIDAEVRRRLPDLYQSHRALFQGPISDLDDAYRAANRIVLPIRFGHGISIKTIEAMSSGLPLIATPLAFRGMTIEAERLSNVTIANDAPRFAEALRFTKGSAPVGRLARHKSDTYRTFETMFAFEAYRRNLLSFVAPLLSLKTPYDV